MWEKSSVAVVGISVRVPGASDPDGFWSLLADGVDATAPLAPGQWGLTGTMASGVPWRGGSLAPEYVRGFDPDFFGISPREAGAMDPQQRLALELAWEALENAGIAPDDLANTDTGVYVGACADDWSSVVRASGTALDRYTLAGRGRSLIANRISYLLKTRGASLSVDTGQSSSLTAVHLAATAIAQGTVNTALVGGVQLNLSSHSTEEAEQFGGLSPDGRCFTFDERANGYVRGEGGAFVVLQDLAQAQASGRRIYAIVQGSAAGNDGGGGGLTAPDPAGQASVLRAAYENAGVDPAAVDYVELHGTGTAVGDPVEAHALGGTVGAASGRTSPLRVGSVKTNIGHLEGAAGIAGFVKTALALYHRTVPASLNFVTANPNIDLDAQRLSVQTAAEPWPERAESGPVAGVSSFGMGGSNCHVVLAGALRPAERSTDAQIVPFVLSARTPSALRVHAANAAKWIERHQLSTGDAAYTAALGRHVFPFRLAVAADSPDELAAALRDARTDTAEGVRGKTAYLFAGQGSQRLGAGRELYRRFPAYARAFDDVCVRIDSMLDRPLTSILFAEDGSDDAALLDLTQYTQPAVFAVEVASYRLLESWGIVPDVLLGHSIGEIAAAHVAGIFDLDDACRLAVLRGGLMGALPSGGAMLSVELPAADVADAIAALPESTRPDIAAVNSPRATVVAGTEASVAALGDAVAPARTKRLDVSHAFHSALMEPVVAELDSVLSSITFASPEIPLVSAVTGRDAGETMSTPQYWSDQVRATVQFAAGVDTLYAAGVRRFVELGPSSTVAASVGRTIADFRGESPAEPTVTVSLMRRGREDVDSAVSALGALFVSGVQPQWRNIFDADEHRIVSLPTYPFEREPYWIDPAPQIDPARQIDPAHHTAPSAQEPLAAASGSRDVAEIVRAQVSRVLGHRTAVDTDRTFESLGADSLALVEILSSISAEIGVALPETLLFDHPTPASLAQFLAAGDEPRRETPRESARSDSEPIAIVGMGCRLPGGISSPEALWQALIDETDAIGSFPTERGWALDSLFDDDADVAGKSFVDEGGFVSDAHTFDPAFFGISAREAIAMDPQQRVILETTWHALEHARIVPSSLAGTNAGVFTGIMPQDYGPRMHRADPDSEGYLLTGTTTSVGSGRIAYTLGLEGPAVSIDTACSSSLVATHMAVRSLRSGEVDLAVAGGVTIIANPGIFVELTRQRALSPRGRCRAFSDDADGTGWAEGAAVLVLQRLSDAQRDGREVLAVITGSAINQDGASNGLTAPSGLAQRAVIDAALADAGLTADDVDAIEAHGTGTRLGDPVEANALVQAFADRSAQAPPLWLGSLKSNIGHTQAAAGSAGLLKAVLALRHERLPKTLHVETPTSRVDWDSTPLTVLTEPVDWRRSTRPRRMGVSSFGISGTNSHLVVEEAPAVSGVDAKGDDRPAGVVPLLLSARDSDALTRTAQRLIPTLEKSDIHAVARSLHVSRDALDTRAVVLVDPTDVAGATAMLTAFAEGEESAAVVTGVRARRENPVFVFPGQGSQWTAMAADMYDEFPVFADSVNTIDAAIFEFAGWHVRDVLLDRDGAPDLERIDVVQPVLFAMMSSLARWWQSMGVEPAAVVGHSQGEIAAAYIAGILTLEDAAHIVVSRSRAWLQLRGQGAMLSVMASGARVLSELEPWQERIGIAAVNSPLTVAVSGDTDALNALSGVLTAAGIENKLIPGIDVAGHSPQVDRFASEFAVDLASVSPAAGQIPFYSTVTGGRADGTSLDADYWFENMRRTVEFEKTSVALLSDGHRTFLECSPHPLLASSLDSTSSAHDADVTVLRTVKRGTGDRAAALSAVAAAWVSGIDIDWDAVLVDAPVVDLPLYPFERKALWLGENSASTSADPTSMGIVVPEHPLLSSITTTPGSGGVVATGRIDARDARLHGSNIENGSNIEGGSNLENGTEPIEVSAGLCAELISAVADELGDLDVGTLRMTASVIVDADAPVDLRIEATELTEVTELTEAAGCNYAVAVHARHVHARPDQPWTPVADATLVAAGVVEPARESGGLRIRADAAKADAGFAVDPEVLTSIAQAAKAESILTESWVEQIDGYRVFATGATELVVSLTPLPDGVAVVARDVDGRPVLSIDRMRVGVAPVVHRPYPDHAHTDQAHTDHADSLHVVHWESVPMPQPQAHAGVGRILDVVRTGESDPTVLVANTIRTVSEWTAEHSGLLVVLTESATSVDEGEAASVDPVQAAVAGALRSVQAENPGRIVVIDRRGTVSDEHVAAVASSGITSGALRGDRVYVPRLRPIEAVRTERYDAVAAAADRDGTVLITGGTGTLGVALARHLVEHRGIRHLVLIGRRGLAAPGASDVARELTDLGASVRIEAVDAADRHALGALLAGIDVDHPLVGVVHAAGRLDDGVASSMTEDRVAGVVMPKAVAAQNLLDLTADTEFVVFYSSMVAALGNPGQSNYAAANAYLDATAVRARALGRPVWSAGWGLWATASGMSEHLSSVDLDRMRASGVLPLDTQQGLAMFDALVRGESASVLAVELDRAALAERVDDADLSPLLRSLVPRKRRRAGVRETGSEPSNAFGDMLPHARAHALADAVRAEVARVLGDDAVLAEDTPFKEAGFDSLMTLELRNRLARRVGIALPGTVVFDHPTTSDLASYLASRFGDVESAPAPDEAHTRSDAEDDPIVVVSMACRLPGGISEPDQLWDLLQRGGSAIGPMPTDRGWRTDLYDPERRRPGTSATDRGGFLYDAAEFDAQFFSISPREATAMDPQQRLLLETAWETVERAGIDPHSLRGDSVGVYIGSVGQDYLGADDALPEQVEGFGITGKASSVASGRISYFLGLEGPSMTVDTACSSSLVALHLATKALRGGECTAALVGGVSIMSRPSLFVEFSRQQGLAADGTCKSFGAAADGTGWAEGVTMLMVERQSDAHRLGHRILGVIEGSAVNQDGASNGLTAPNGRSQQRVIAAALNDAGVTAADIDLVEAHGTGTTLGDPIEADAIVSAYGAAHSADAPVWLGSLKSNIGHTQGSAGIAGVIKILLSLAHDSMPATLGATPPTPHVDWSADTVALLHSARSWPAGTRPRRAGISAFGISGTNAHVIIAEPRPGAPAATEPHPAPRALNTDIAAWPISASSTNGVDRQADRLVDWVGTRGGHSLDSRSIGAALATTRAGLEYRTVVRGHTIADATAALTAGPLPDSSRDGASGYRVGRAVGGRTAFVFSGQGAQWVGMGRDLYRQSPVFAEAFDDACSHLNPLLGTDLAAAVFGTDTDPALESTALDDTALDDTALDDTALDDTALAQPALFAFSVAMARLLGAAGVAPDYLVGHSIGEIAAAYVSGTATMADACGLVAARGKAMSVLPAGGGMVAVAAPHATVRAAIRGRADVGIAAVNSATACVVSGPLTQLREIADSLSTAGIRCRELRVSHAFHSPLMEPAREAVLDAARHCAFGQRSVEIVSTVTGALVEDEFTDPEYWATHTVAEVRFAEAIEELGRRGVTRVVEIGPDSALVAAIRETMDPEMGDRITGTMRRTRDQVGSVLDALASVWIGGGSVDWSTVIPAGVTPAELPTYAFDRTRFWLEPSRPDTAVAQAITEAADFDAFRAALGLDRDVSAAELFDALRAFTPGVDVQRRQWRYDSSWTPVDIAAADVRAHTVEPVLILIPEGADARVSALVDTLTGWEQRTRIVEVNTVAHQLIPRDSFSSVISLLAFDDEARADRSGLSQGTLATLAVAQELVRRSDSAPLWVVTSGAFDGSSTHAGVWGLARVLGVEHPQSLAGLIDLADTSVDTRAHLIDLLDHDTGREYEFRVDARGASVHRLERAPRTSGDDTGGGDTGGGDTGGGDTGGGVWQPRGRILITGGTGGLGAEITRWAARQGAEEVVLLSRSGSAASGAAELVAELNGAAAVTVLACDVGDREDLNAVLDGIERGGSPITAVVHAAGIVASTPITELSAADLLAQARGKVGGADNLDAYFAGRELDAFVLFSSVSGTWGSGGHGAYAAANAGLDGVARRRVRRGDTATSIAWGPWEGTGMITGDGVEHHLRTRGLRPMNADAAVRALAEAAGKQGVGEQGTGRQKAVCTVVADIDWDRFVALMSVERPRPQFDGLVTERAASDERDASDELGENAAERFERDLRDRPHEDRVRVVVDIVREHAADVLGFGSLDDVPADRAFRDAGFDSLMAVELRDRTAKSTGITVTAVMIFDHPTPIELATALVAERFPDPAPGPVPQPARDPARDPAPEPHVTSPELNEAGADDVFAYIDSMLEVPR